MTTTLTTAPSPVETAERCKREIVRDVADGTVPAEVRSFSQLHDHVDANTYGGMCDDGFADLFASPDAWTEHCNAASAIVDAWIAEGGIARDTITAKDMRTGVVTRFYSAPTVIAAGEYEARVARLRAEAARLPLDLDGDRYRVFDGLGAWKVTACCGCPVTGTDSGICCKGCYEDRSDFPDGPARLHPTDPKVAPASETAVRITL